MKFSQAIIAAVAALPYVSAHIKLVDPKPYIGTDDGLGHLAVDGSNYPCTVGAEFMVYNEASAKVMTAGATNQFRLEGGAVHGGGSCQISITTDLTPNKNSKFRVIKSFEGACPVEAGNENISGSSQTPHDPKSFLLPEDVPEGKGVLAWTWFNKVGNREMYMRCAPILIKNSSGGDLAKFNSRPEIFKANIGNGCSTPAGFNVIFPQPGDQKEGTGNAKPEGTCQSAADPGPAPETPTPDARRPKEGAIGDDQDEIPDILAPGEKAPATPSPAPAPVPAPGNGLTPPLIEKKPEIKLPVESDKPAPAPAPVAPAPSPIEKPAAPPVNTPPAADKPAAGGAGSCAVNGQIYCNGESKFYICNFGKLVDMGAVAAGTKCVNNVIQRRNMVRFSAAHMRRRHHHKL